MNACSAGVGAAELRCEARGAATASGSVIPRSMRFMRICVTVVMIVDPPGEPTTNRTSPSSSTIVGDIDDRGRLPGSTMFGSVGFGRKLKSVSSLFSRKPRPGTVMPDPPVDSIVSVYATALPHWSTTERCVVETPSVSARSSNADRVAAGRVERRRPARAGPTRSRGRSCSRARRRTPG